MEEVVTEGTALEETLGSWSHLHHEANRLLPPRTPHRGWSHHSPSRSKGPLTDAVNKAILSSL